MKNNDGSVIKNVILPTIIGMAAAVILVVALKSAFGIVIVSGSSMNPTYYDGDVLHGKVVTGELKRGDVVTIKEGNETIIKRIVGLPGETIAFKDGSLFIDNQILETDFPLMKDGGILNRRTVTLKDDEYFVLGDNRNNSKDSRYYGPVKKSQIQFVIVKTYFAFPHEKDSKK